MQCRRSAALMVSHAACTVSHAARYPAPHAVAQKLAEATAQMKRLKQFAEELTAAVMVRPPLSTPSTPQYPAAVMVGRRLRRGTVSLLRAMRRGGGRGAVHVAQDATDDY